MMNKIKFGILGLMGAVIFVIAGYNRDVLGCIAGIAVIYVAVTNILKRI